MLKQFTCSAHYIHCRIGSHKPYTTVKILLKKKYLLSGYIACDILRVVMKR